MSILRPFFFFFFLSCSKEAVHIEDQSKLYYPLDFKQKIYAADSLLFDENHTIPTSISFQIKEWIEDSLWDNQNRQHFLIKQVYRKNEETHWINSEEYYVHRNFFEIQEVRNKVRNLTLRFPLEIGNLWNPKIYFETEFSDTTLVSSKTHFILNTYMTIEPVFEIQLENRVNLVDSIIKKEKYGKNVGLVEKIVVYLNKQPNKNLSGFVYTQKLIGIEF